MTDGAAAIKLAVVEVARPTRAEHWQPFADGHERYTYGWWDDSYRFWHLVNRRWFAAYCEGTEVGRAEVEIAAPDDYYLGAAVLGDAPILEVQFIDVADDFKRRGVATAIVTNLIAAFPIHTVVAFSEEADAFWASLGWTRIEHPDGTASHRPLFVQPLVSESASTPVPSPLEI